MHECHTVRMKVYICLLLLVNLDSINTFLQQNRQSTRTRGFDSYVGPTSSPYMEPFSGGFGQGSPLMGMLPFMMADIDYADQMSSRADAKAARQEAMQGQQESMAIKVGQPGNKNPINRLNRNNAYQRGNPSDPYVQRQSMRQSDPYPQRQSMRQSDPYPQQQSMIQSDPYPQRRLEGNQNPYFQERSGQTIATEQGSLFGLKQNIGKMSSESKKNSSTPTKWVFKQSQTQTKPLKPTPISKRSSGLLPQQEANRLRLSQVLSSSNRQQFKDIANSAISKNELTTTNNKYNNYNSRKPSRFDRKPPPRKQRIDPDLMSDMMDMAADLGLASMFMPPMSRRGARCDLSSVKTLIEYLMTGKMCGTKSHGMRFGLGRR
ncbi:uncharacterized protein LOC127729466 [Mytilus californianus]|uniref:uncharacterized protein LOC127729466 n=1 Tax=Mytilus californianus TaxID=6549 RepID=UPI0022485CE6|nr:uncharacterized protein LOC127729466 [Mytilus californianus]